jgi:hypothetical protein
MAKPVRRSRRKPPAPNLTRRRPRPATDPVVLERTNKEAEADYRARHASGATRVTTVDVVPREDVEALAQKRAAELVGRHHTCATRRWLDEVLQGKTDVFAIVNLTCSVSQVIAVRNALQAAGY